MSGTPEPRVYRVVIADDTYLIREGLRQVLEGEEAVEVVAYASSLPALLREVEEHRPDVVITDIRMPPTNTDEGIQAAAELQALGCEWVLIKGGHGNGEIVTDLLFGPDRMCMLSSRRRPGGPYHGTGCALSAAITALLAHGQGMREAAREGRDYVQRLLKSAVALGKGSLVLYPGEVSSES